jgi:hypothetical protein
MNRPAVEVAHILHAQGDRFLEKNRSWLSYQLSVAAKKCAILAVRRAPVEWLRPGRRQAQE